MTQKTIKHYWTLYAETVIPKTAGPGQIIESRRAFYAGADCFYTLLMNLLEPGTEPTDGDLALMQRLHDEIGEFADDIKSGRA